MASLVGFFLLPHQQLKYRLIIARLKIKAMEKNDSLLCEPWNQ
ncbi:hypothetical protein [Photobacterium iliopiscarium]|nr:hypothetical protein [Photobacterium iliopiscarium]